MSMTKRELIDILTDEYINSYNKREDSHYYMFQRIHEDLLNIIRITTSATAMKAQIYDMISLGLPYVVEQSLLEFVDPFVNKTEDEIKANPELHKIISERILKLAKDPKTEEKNPTSSESSDPIEIKTNAAASKVKAKKSKNKENSVNEMFNIFNTF